MTKTKCDQLAEMLQDTCRKQIEWGTPKDKLVMLRVIQQHSMSWDVSLEDALDLVDWLCEGSRNG